MNEWIIPSKMCKSNLLIKLAKVELIGWPPSAAFAHSFPSAKIIPFNAMLYFMFIFLFLIIPSSSFGQEPFWIDSPTKAELAGLKLELVKDQICRGEKVEMNWIGQFV